MKFGHFDFLLRMFLLATGMAGIFGGLAMCEAKHVDRLHSYGGFGRLVFNDKPRL